MTPKRPTCETCRYPANTCICDHVSPVDHDLNLIVLQHPKEVDNRKNTVCLLTLASRNCTVVPGESEQDFIAVKQQVEENPEIFALLYPSKNAQTISSTQPGQVKHLILIDGTWKKSRKILFANPWLQDIPNLVLEEAVGSHYYIRKRHHVGGLSTIEAAAYALQKLEGCSTDSFLKILDGFQEAFTRHMPHHVTRRYDTDIDPTS